MKSTISESANESGNTGEIMVSKIETPQPCPESPPGFGLCKDKQSPKAAPVSKVEGIDSSNESSHNGAGGGFWDTFSNSNDTKYNDKNLTYKSKGGGGGRFHNNHHFPYGNNNSNSATEFVNPNPTINSSGQSNYDNGSGGGGFWDNFSTNTSTNYDRRRNRNGAHIAPPAQSHPSNQHSHSHHPHANNFINYSKPLLASDGTVGYGGSEYINFAYGLDSAPEKLKYKWNYLWKDFDLELRNKIKMDEVAAFSITDLRTADAMSDHLLAIEGVTSSSVITDATACVGGNTISFIRNFERVNAIELDELRSGLLRENLENVRDYYSGEDRKEGVPLIKFGEFKVFQGSCLDICPTLKQDIIFLDPPWGGVTYRNRGTITLFLSGVSLGEVCKKLGSFAKFLALKLPLNVDIHEIVNTSGGEFVSAMPLDKMQFVILRYSKTLSTDQMQMLQSFGLLNVNK